ncbi:MAG: cache domain-containing protein [Gammaproteobacteria bacterium]|nr:cache domain-containing protein [Gammaproteobacteria bacterium]
MFTPFKKLKIGHRLAALVAVSIIGLVLVGTAVLVETRSVMLEQKRLKVKNVVETASGVVEHYATLASEGVMTEPEARQAATEAVKRMRYDGSGYFWINDMQARMVMHPVDSQLDGTDLSGLKDVNGKAMFVESVNTVAKSGEGFVDSMWTRPGADVPEPKLSYVKGFEPWQWVIGSDIYLSDMDSVFWAEFKVLAVISLLTVAVLVFLFWAITRSIVGSLQAAIGVAKAIADGKLDNEIRVDSLDESGQVMQALQLMQNNLCERIGQDEKTAAEVSRIKQALDNVSANVMVADDDHNIIYLNKTVESMFRNAQQDIRKDLPNFDVDRLKGQNIDSFHKNPSHQRKMLSLLTDEHQAEINVGGRIMGFIANPVTSESGVRLGTVVEWKDRTAERAVEEEVQTIVERARAGDLTQRISVADKQGFFITLSNGINDLLDVNEQIINDIQRVLGAMARGNLSETIQADYHGSFEQLKNDANATVAKLTEVIGKVKTGADQIRIDAGEIAQGNSNLSQRTDEQASSLEQTASSMEEMTSTVKQNSDNAAEASELATGARNMAEQGGSVVSLTVEAMSEINDSSRKIASIIGVIDEIAFQTNLLALNAAVEAARAGDQGRGFAVVANEVRNLAQRSANAAKEIKGLIEDSVCKVDNGTKLVDESGEMLEQIVTSVKKVSDIVAEIAAASNEQSIGIEQVSRAISHMDEMTQQNAALVEQAAAASESMSNLAQGMSGLMAFFQLDESESLREAFTERRSSRRPWAEKQPDAELKPPLQPVIQAGGGSDWDTF